MLERMIKMGKITDENEVLNTGCNTILGYYSHKDADKWDHFTETLFRDANGNLYLYVSGCMDCEGFCRSIEPDGDISDDFSLLYRPLDGDEWPIDEGTGCYCLPREKTFCEDEIDIRSWVERYCDGDLYESIFGPVPE